MTLILPNSAIFHIPKTGGTWVRQAVYRSVKGPIEDVPCRKCVHSKKEEKDVCCYHASPLTTHYDLRKKFGIVFVRHPADLYRSLWCHLLENKIVKYPKFKQLRMQFFSYFVKERIRLHQRQTTNWLYRYGAMHIGPGSLIQFIGHQERLEDDLVHALRLAGETFDEEILRATPPTNQKACTPKWERRSRMTPRIWKRIITAEHEAIEHLGYTTDYDAYMAKEYFATAPTRRLLPSLPPELSKSVHRVEAPVALHTL